MKRLLSLLLLSSMLTGLQAKSLVLSLKDGTLVYYYLEGEKSPVMTWDGEGSIVVNADEYAISGIKHFYISDDDDPNAIASMPASQASFRGGWLTTTAPVDAPVGVYTTDGKHVDTAVSRDGHSVRINLNALPKGIYVVAVGKSTFKVSK